MYEFEIMNLKTGEFAYVYGYTKPDAFRRSNKALNEWVVTNITYVD